MNDYVASLIRTYVPIAVGALVAWLAGAGVILPEDASNQLVLFLGALASAVYYAVVRAAEKRWPWVGNLLGTAKAPVYVPPAEITPANRDNVISDVTAKVDNLYETKTLG